MILYYTTLYESDLLLLGEGTSKKGLGEGSEWDISFLILSATTVSHDLFSLLGGEDLTKRLEYVGKFSSHQGSVVKLVIDLKTLKEIIKGSHILLLLELAEDGKNFLNGHLLLTTVLGSTGLLHHSLSDAEVKRPHEGTQILGIDLTFGEGVVDLEVQFAHINFSWLKIGHFPGV